MTGTCMFVLATVIVLALAAIIAVNIWDWRRRQRLTPTERGEEDAESRRQANIW